LRSSKRETLSRKGRNGRSPAEPEIRNKFKKLEISKMQKWGPEDFFAGRQQIGLLQCQEPALSSLANFAPLA
jgi:hypothetical protein